MNRRIITFLMFTTLLTACEKKNKSHKEDRAETTEIKTPNKKAEYIDEGVETQIEKKTPEETIESNPEINVKEMVRQGMLSYLQANQRAIMFSENPDTEIKIDYLPFRPNNLVKSDFYLIQISYKEGDFYEKEDFGVIYSSLNDGSYDPSQYRLIEGDDRACSMCNLDRIEMKDIGGFESIVTHFEYRSNGEKITSSLNCDLVEMTFYWLD